MPTLNSESWILSWLFFLLSLLNFLSWRLCIGWGYSLVWIVDSCFFMCYFFFSLFKFYQHLCRLCFPLLFFSFFLSFLLLDHHNLCLLLPFLFVCFLLLDWESVYLFVLIHFLVAEFVEWRCSKCLVWVLKMDIFVCNLYVTLSVLGIEVFGVQSLLCLQFVYCLHQRKWVYIKMIKVTNFIFCTACVMYVCSEQLFWKKGDACHV